MVCKIFFTCEFPDILKKLSREEDEENWQMQSDLEWNACVSYFCYFTKENKETILFKDESKKWNILKNGKNIFLASQVVSTDYQW